MEIFLLCFIATMAYFILEAIVKMEPKVLNSNRPERPLLNSNIMKCTVEYKFSNGDKVKEIVTGITGIVTGSVSYLTGCNQHLITLKPKDEFADATSIWYDDSRLELVEHSKIKLDIDDDKPGADVVPPGGNRGY